MFCRNCGKALHPNELNCAACSAPRGMGTAFCPNCGNPTTPGWVTCPVCGTGLVAMPTYKQKSKIAAGLLGILIGAFGVHNFYLGYTGKAVAQLLITVLSCGFLSFVSAIWALIEGIQILTGSINVDASGMPLKD